MPRDLSKLVALSDTLRDKTAKAKTKSTGQSWYRVRNAVDRAEIYIYDAIGEWGVSAQDFVGELRDIDAANMDIHINCEGGEVFDGIAIYQALVNHPAHVTTIVDSLAASAASFIAQAGDHRVMGKNARMMIHDAGIGGAFAEGNAAAMREFAQEVLGLADLLDDLSNNIASIYADRAGGTTEDWRAKMLGEQWYSAEAAVEAGLADEVQGAQKPTNKTSAPPVLDMSAFAQMVKEAVA